MKMDKCDMKGLAVGIGAAWGIYVMLAGWSVMLFSWWSPFVTAMGSMYMGYGPSFIGGIIGGIWGFFDGAAFGIIVAFVYNLVTVRGKKRR